MFVKFPDPALTFPIFLLKWLGQGNYGVVVNNEISIDLKEKSENSIFHDMTTKSGYIFSRNNISNIYSIYRDIVQLEENKSTGCDILNVILDVFSVQS